MKQQVPAAFVYPHDAYLKFDVTVSFYRIDKQESHLIRFIIDWLRGPNTTKLPWDVVSKI